MNMSRSNTDRRVGVLARARRFAFAGVLVTGAALSLPALSSAASATTISPSGTGVCPPDVGQAKDCGVLITINANGSVSITSPANNNNPYDGHDDTVIGVKNNSTASLASLMLTSSKDIFGFDGDGICTEQPFHNPDGTAGGSSYCAPIEKVAHITDSGVDYQGPDNTFSGISSDKKSGVVDFTNPVAGGSSTFFSLENDLAGCAGGASGGDESSVRSHNTADTTVPTDCVSIPKANLTIDKVDNNGKALDGAKFTVYTAAHQGGTATPCDASATGSCTLTGLSAGEYWIDETTTPTGYQTAAEQTVLVLGSNVTVTVTDDPVVVPVAPSGGTTTTTTTTTPAAATVAGATTVHTGESFAGSQPYVLAVVGAGFGLLGAGLIRRRRARAAARR